MREIILIDIILNGHSICFADAMTSSIIVKDDDASVEYDISSEDF